MLGRSRDLKALEHEHAELEELIAAHPLSSRRIRAAERLVDEGRSRDTARIDEQLTAAGLPRVEELGRTYASSLWSWWRLHRRKRTLEHRIRRARTR